MTELRSAFREAARREFAAVPAEHDIDYVFSPGFQRKIRRIIHAQAHGYWQLVNTAAKRAACVAAIIAMLLTTVMAIKPIRERVIRFFVEVYEEYFEIRFGREEKDDIDPTPQPMVRYTLTELPEGYGEVEFIESEHLLWTVWENEEGRKISLQQELGTNEITFNLNEENVQWIEYAGIEIACQITARTNLYVWEQNDYIFYLGTYGQIPKETALKIIESLEIYK